MTDIIDSIRDSLFMDKFINELTVLEKENEGDKLSFVTDRINNLNKIVAFLKEPKQKKTEKLDVLELAEKFMYKKAWSKLPDIHKFNKLKEYMLSLTMEKDKRKELLKELVVLLKSKELRTSKYITYNQFEGKIEKIKVLICENKEWKVDMTEDKPKKKITDNKPKKKITKK